MEKDDFKEGTMKCAYKFPSYSSWTIKLHVDMPNRWENNGNSERLYLGGSKITADGDCSHAIKRRLLLGRKSMTKLDSILKSRDITLPTSVTLAKSMVFSSSHVHM